MRAHRCLPFVALLLSCDAPRDGSAEAACGNAACPVGTVIHLEATSVSQCEAAGSAQVATASGGVEGRCFVGGACQYVCAPVSRCCGSELWTQAAYRCEQPCCPNGAPPPCGGGCGNGDCEIGETPVDCPQDCADTCGDNVCTGAEGPEGCPQDCQAACGNQICERGETPEACPDDCVLGGVFQVDPALLDFGSYRNGLSFGIVNRAPTGVTWRAESDAGWLTLSQAEGAAGDAPVTVTVEVDRQRLQPRSYEAVIRVSASGGHARTLRVWMSVADPSAPLEPDCAPPCREGHFCLGGACVSTCNPECPAGTLCRNGECRRATEGGCEGACPEVGQAVCVSADRYATCDVAGDCPEWSDAQSCPPQTLCVSGRCFAPENCTPTCAGAGTRECSGPSAYRVCELLAGCPLWSGDRPCGDGAACDQGRCTNTRLRAALIQPVDGAQTDDDTPFFQWTPVTGADVYELQLDVDRGFGAPHVERRQSTSYTPSSPLAPGAHYWRVRVAVREAWTAWSDVWSVTVR